MSDAIFPVNPADDKFLFHRSITNEIHFGLETWNCCYNTYKDITLGRLVPL